MKICFFCKGEFEDTHKGLYLPIKKVWFCGSYCKYKSQARLAEVTCTECGKKRLKPISQIRNSTNNFCSRTCAGQFSVRNNLTHLKTGHCKNCGIPISNKRVYCFECWSKRAQAKPSTLEKTIGELRRRGTHKFHGAIREQARQILKAIREINICQECGYDEDIEVCHIKAVAEFSDNALLREVNDPSNLMALCARCHKRFDRKRKEALGLVSLQIDLINSL